MVSTILICRHGYRSNWLQDVPIPDPPTGIDSDYELAPHGLEQAEELGVYLSTHEPRIQRVYSSPFYRCVETARPVARYLGLPILAEAGFGEYFKPDRKVHPIGAAPQTLHKLIPEVDPNYKSLLVPSSQGETVNEIHERAAKAIHMVIDKLNSENPEIETILIVTHAAAKIALGRGLLQDRSREIRTGTCSLDTYRLRPGSQRGEPGEWEAVSLGCTHFLSNGEEMHWNFESRFEAGSNEDIEFRRLMAEKEKQVQGIGEKIDVDKIADQAIRAVADRHQVVNYYIPVDIPRPSRQAPFVLTQNTPVQIVGLHTERPLFKIGDGIYEGTWHNTVGTELYVNGEGQVIGKSRARLQLCSGTLEKKQTLEQTQPLRKKNLAESVREINARRRAQNETQESVV